MTIFFVRRRKVSALAISFVSAFALIMTQITPITFAAVEGGVVGSTPVIEIAVPELQPIEPSAPEALPPQSLEENSPLSLVEEAIAPDEADATPAENLGDHTLNEIESRLQGLTPSPETTNLFLPGINYEDGTGYERNEDNLLSDVDLTGISPWNSFSVRATDNMRAGTLITPQHMVMARHWYTVNGTVFHFVDNDNVIHERTQVSGVTAFGDAFVVMLDSPLPDSIKFLPLINFEQWQESTPYGFDSPIHGVFLDTNNEISVIQMSDSHGVTARYGQPRYMGDVDLRLPFWSRAISGDSGSPAITIINGEAVLMTTLSTTASGPQYASHIDELNAALDTLSSRYLGDSYQTGDYQVTVRDVSEFIVPETNPPVILTQPQSIDTRESRTITLTVRTQRTLEEPIYQWQSDGVDIEGANDSSYTIQIATLDHSGANYTVKITNDFGTTISEAALITVEEIPVFGLSFEAEDGHVLSPFYTGFGDSIFQWSETLDPTEGGLARYEFNVEETGNYILNASVQVWAERYNSFFVDVDSEPGLHNAWIIEEFTDGFEQRTVGWESDAGPHVFFLTRGQHELFIRGRGHFTMLDSLSFEPTDLPFVPLWRDIAKPFTNPRTQDDFGYQLRVRPSAQPFFSREIPSVEIEKRKNVELFFHGEPWLTDEEVEIEKREEKNRHKRKPESPKKKSKKVEPPPVEPPPIDPEQQFLTTGEVAAGGLPDAHHSQASPQNSD